MQNCHFHLALIVLVKTLRIVDTFFNSWLYRWAISDRIAVRLGSLASGLQYWKMPCQFGLSTKEKGSFSWTITAASRRLNPCENFYKQLIILLSGQF